MLDLVHSFGPPARTVVFPPIAGNFSTTIGFLPACKAAAARLIQLLRLRRQHLPDRSYLLYLGQMALLNLSVKHGFAPACLTARNSI